MNNCFYSPFYRYRYPPNHMRKAQPNFVANHTKQTPEQTETKSSDSTSRGCSFSTNNPLLEFHGIKLYNDDLLILALLFFLYKEHINDTLLYILLFMLLLTD